MCPLNSCAEFLNSPGWESRLQDLLAERHAALASPRQVARFLCGLTSPATTRAKLRAHPMYGLLGAMPFHDVLTLAESEMGQGQRTL